jgi:NarL family two-component system response regulator LiaR
MSDGQIRVLVVDDHPVLRKGIYALLSTEPGIEVIGEAADGSEAIAAVDHLEPDVVLMDLVMPGVDGVEATRQIIRKRPQAHILVLTSFGSDDKLFPAIKAGALGFLMKDASPEELITAIRNVARGQSSLHPTVARRLLQELTSNTADTKEPIESLTEREIDVLREIAHGLSNDDIAEKLFISAATVRTHVSNILSKLDVTSRTQAALWALRNGIVKLEENQGSP